MATNDPIALLLSDHLEESKQGSVGTWRATPISSQILKSSILVAPAVAIVFAVLLLGNPLLIFASATAPPAAAAAPQDGTRQLIPTIQPIASAQTSPQILTEVPTRDDIAAAFNTAYQSHTETRQPPAQALFKQFQAWAAEEDAKSRAEPVPLAQDARAQAVQNARAQVRPPREHRQVRSEHNSRAKVRRVKTARVHVGSKRYARPQVLPKHDAGLQIRPVRNAPAPGQSVQNAWIQWPDRPFGWLHQN
jgi:hypothetical protein